MQKSKYRWADSKVSIRDGEADRNRQIWEAIKHAANDGIGGADQSETLPISPEYVDGSQEQSFQVNGNTTTNLLGLAKQIAEQDLYSLNARTAMLIGAYTVDWGKTKKENIPKKDKSMFSQERYQFFLDAPFEISNLCCNVMKKEPVHRYQKKTGRNPMTAQMASESRLRTQNWLKSGCNGFDLKSPISNPMAFWTEQDVLLYIYHTKLPICSVYGEVVKDGGIDGQMDMEDLFGKELFDLGRPTLKTTGAHRTGCMFCGFGCHLEKGEGRFERIKRTHPKQYDYIMRPWEEGGLNYKEVIDWINEHGNFNIKY